MEADDIRVHSLAKRPAVYARPEMSLRQLAVLLTEEGIGAALVRGPRHAEGLVSERDVVRALAEGASPKQTRVDELMTEDLVTVGPNDSLLDAVRTMLEAEVRHLPIVEDGVHTGMISARDALRAFADDAAQRAAAAARAAKRAAPAKTPTATAKKPTAKKATVKKAAAMKATAKKTVAKKTAAKRSARRGR